MKSLGNAGETPMNEREDVVAAVLSAAGGKLTGRVRLQKAVYLMERLGLESGFSFDYHHYGPYSRELDYAMNDAKASDLVDETFGRRQSDGASFSIFSLKGDAKPDALGKLGQEKARELARLFAETNVTVLELAATVDWLWRFENCDDWKSEITKRKGAKVQAGRLDKAVELLAELDLRPRALPASA